jgi:hypothetical protein
MKIIEGNIAAPEARVAIVVARFNSFINDSLVNGALGYSTMSTRTQIFTCTYFLIATALIFTTRIGNMTPGETGYTTLKKQIMLNIKYTATPWNYIAVSSWNKVSAINQEKVYIGTFLPHFYTRFYAPDTVHYLPLTLDQEFFWRKKNHLATQYHIYDDLMTHYKKLIVSGASVYITDAYVSNSAHWGNIFKKYHDTFHMKKVSSDCLDTCSLYQLSL